jgi:hypothetical protein
MSAFDDLKKFFNPVDTTRVVPDDPFMVIDRDRTVTKLRLEERAKQNGAKNFPSADSNMRDDVEEEIVAEMLEHANRDKSNASNTHRLYNERLSELALLRELSIIAGASAQALGDFKTTVLSHDNRLALAKDAIRESYRELADFKLEHGLKRPAHRGLNPIYALSTVGISWLVESGLSTALLRVNDDYGLIGGFIAAAVIAAINVFLSAAVGRFWWPYLFHKHPLRRVLALLGSAAWVILLTIWNLLAGHFRDAKSAGLSEPEVEAIRLLLERTWSFDSIYSYGLLAAGIAFALLAATAAYKMKDPYPGYGDIYERHEDRCGEYSDEFEYAIEDLQETRDDAIASARAVSDELRRQFGERGQIISAREAHRKRFRERQEYLEGVGNFLLSRYRSINVQTRTDGQAPSHFKERWSLGRAELPVDHDESLDTQVQSAQKALAESIRIISAAFDTAVEKLEPLDKLKESLAHEPK